MTLNLSTIANRAHVSQATVSRVINNKTGVSRKTRETVLAEMRQMGIPLATVRSKSCDLVALISPNLLNPIFTSYVIQINTMLAQQNMLPILCTYTIGGATQQSYIDLLQMISLKGAIFLAGNYDNALADHSIYDSFVDRGIPMAFLNASNHDQPGLYAETDDSLATQIALKHLTDLGHRRIGLLLGDHEHYPTMEKYSAAQKYFADHNIEHPDNLTQWTTYGISSGAYAARKLIQEGATAILCASDQLAVGAVKAAKQMGKSIPRDLSIVGYDDSSLIANLTPTITSIRQPVARLSQALVQGIIAMNENPKIEQRKDVLRFQPELVVRESTGPLKKN